MSIPVERERSSAPHASSLVDAQPSLSSSPVPGGRRRAILDWLRDAAGPRTAAEVADHHGLHLNTARFHLDGLVELGLAVRASEEGGRPGRPRVLYRALDSTPGDDGPRSYRLLSRMLAGLVSSLDEDGVAALETGRSWGRHLVDQAAPSERLDEDQAVQRLHEVMERVGFAPETRPGGAPEVHLHHCPFLEVVEESSDVVCTMHLGLMQGALDELGTPAKVTGLQPFATPRSCVARLTTTPNRPGAAG